MRVSGGALTSDLRMMKDAKKELQISIIIAFMTVIANRSTCPRTKVMEC